METIYASLGADVARLDVPGKTQVVLTLFSAATTGYNGEPIPASSFCIADKGRLVELRDALNKALTMSDSMNESDELPF